MSEVSPRNKHGIYVYEVKSRRWRLYRVEGEAFEIGELGDGVYLIYFDNANCPACRMQDPEWFNFVKDYAEKIRDLHAVVVLCNWFARECSSEAAAKTFKKYDVHASPTILLAYVEGGNVKCMEALVGVKFYRELEFYVKKKCKS